MEIGRSGVTGEIVQWHVEVVKGVALEPAQTHHQSTMADRASETARWQKRAILIDVQVRLLDRSTLITTRNEVAAR